MGRAYLSLIADIMRKNAPFVDMYRAMCSVLGTMRAPVPTVFTALGAMLIAAFGLSGDARSVFASMMAQNGSIVVNTEVVLAVDVSASMTPDEQALQREGYVQALSSREFMQALKASGNGRISITYFEWANVSDQKIIFPWRLIDGPEAAGAVAAELARAPYRRSSRTSISGGLMFAQSLFESSPYRGIRRVIDVSGDGANNDGPLVTLIRDEVLAKGITINGLPIMLNRPNLMNVNVEGLDIYYRDCVIGGPGAFVIPIKEREKVSEAIRNKLVLEVAGRTVAPHPIAAVSNATRISC
jgi:hypothetical protein